MFGQEALSPVFASQHSAYLPRGGGPLRNVSGREYHPASSALAPTDVDAFLMWQLGVSEGTEAGEAFTGRFIVMRPPAKLKEAHPMTRWLKAAFSPSWIFCAAAESWAKAAERSVPSAVVVRRAQPQKCVAVLGQSNAATAVASAWSPCGEQYAAQVTPPSRCMAGWHRPQRPH